MFHPFCVSSMLFILTGGRCAIEVAWISKQLTGTTTICVHSFPDHRVVYLSEVFLLDHFLYFREFNSRTVTQFKAVNSVYCNKLNSRLKWNSFVHESVTEQMSHEQKYHRSAFVVCIQHAVLMLIPETLPPL